MDSPRLGIALPDFLGSDFDRAWELAQTVLGNDTAPGRLFNMGWHGVGYRSRTIQEYAARYTSLPEYGSKDQENNFRSDQALVDYLFNACSAADCIGFAAFGLASGLDAVNFPADDAKQLVFYLRKVADRFESQWPRENLSVLLTEIRDDSGVWQMFTLRDIVAHRGGLPRTHYVGGEFDGMITVPKNIKEIPGRWASNFVVGAPLVAAWHRTLADALSRSVAGVLSFGPLLAAASAKGDR